MASAASSPLRGPGEVSAAKRFSCITEALDGLSWNILRPSWGAMAPLPPLFKFAHAVIGTTPTVCGAGSMKRYGVRRSVCLSRSSAAAACGGFAVVGPAGRRYQSIAAAAASSCGQCHVVSVRRQLSAATVLGNNEFLVTGVGAVVCRRRCANNCRIVFDLCRSLRFVLFSLENS